MSTQTDSTPYTTQDFDGTALTYPDSVTDRDGVVLGIRTFTGSDGEPVVQIIVDDPIDLRAIVNLTPEQWDSFRATWPEQTEQPPVTALVAGRAYIGTQTSRNRGVRSSRDVTFLAARAGSPEPFVQNMNGVPDQVRVFVVDGNGSAPRLFVAGTIREAGI